MTTFDFFVLLPEAMAGATSMGGYLATARATQLVDIVASGSLCEYMGHDVSNMRGFDSYRLLTLSLAALMTRISSAMIEGAHTSAGSATLARTGSLWGRFRSP